MSQLYTNLFNIDVLYLVELALNTDKESSDEHLLFNFVKIGLTVEQAEKAISLRPLYLENKFEQGFSPVFIVFTTKTQCYRYNPDTKLSEPFDFQDK